MQSAALNEAIADRYLSRVRLNVLGESTSARFKKTYQDDRVAFVHDCFEFSGGGGPKKYQERSLALFDEFPRLSIRSPHHGGKSTFAAWCLHHFILTRPDCKIPTTASVWRQLTEYLWPEIHKWARRIRWDIVGRDPYTKDELLTLLLKLSPTQRAFAVASDDPQNIEGAQADSILYIFDEAKIIPTETWDAAEGAFSGAGEDTPMEAKALAISTPGDPVGRFYNIQSRKRGYKHWKVDVWTKEELIEAGMMSRQWALDMKEQWGEKSSVYIQKVEGDFAASEDENLIPLPWIEAAVRRWHGWKDGGGKIPDKIPLRIGIDTAAGGGDKTSIIPLYDDLVPEVIYMDVKNTMRIVSSVRTIIDKARMKTEEKESIRSIQAFTEIIGHGGKGVHDRLEEEEYPVEAVNVSVPTDLKDASGLFGFVNVRSALWWAVREWLDPDMGSKAMLPPDERLEEDLRAPKWEPTSSGKIKVEPKDKTKERLGRSPDAGDALTMTFANPYPRVQIFV